VTRAVSISFFCLLTILYIPCQAAEGAIYPATAYTPKDLPEVRLSLPVEASLGDLIFYNLPRTSELNATERFMLAGGRNRTTRQTVRPWVTNILRFSEGYYDRHDQVASRITPEVISEVSADLSVEEASEMVMFKNPFTLDWPRCDSQEPSAGDLYIRPLNESEVEHMCAYDGLLNSLRKGNDPDPDADNPITLNLPIWYVRAYGQNGRVIYAGLQYTWYSKD
jgi:hypothetical protein